MLMFRCLSSTCQECTARRTVKGITLCFDEEIPRFCTHLNEAIPVRIQERDLYNLIATMPDYADEDGCNIIKLQADLSARSDMAQDLGIVAVCEWDARITATSVTETPSDTSSA